LVGQATSRRTRRPRCPRKRWTLLQGLNARVYERAKGVLQPEQLEAPGGYQTNQLSMQRFGIKMMQGLMCEREPGPEAPPPAAP
jgi:hypothetical protein